MPAVSSDTSGGGPEQLQERLEHVDEATAEAPMMNAQATPPRSSSAGHVQIDRGGQAGGLGKQEVSAGVADVRTGARGSAG